MERLFHALTQLSQELIGLLIQEVRLRRGYLLPIGVQRGAGEGHTLGH